MKKRSSPLNVFFMRFNTGAIFAWISLSSACSSSARLYNGSTRKFTARLKKIIEIPAFPVILFAIVKITSKRSSIGEIINVYKSVKNVKSQSPNQHSGALTTVFRNLIQILYNSFLKQ